MTLFMIITFLITNIIVVLVFRAVYGKKRPIYQWNADGRTYSRRRNRE